MFYRFDQFPLSPLSLKALEDAGFKTMTVVQEATLPIILKGELLGIESIYKIIFLLNLGAYFYINVFKIFSNFMPIFHFAMLMTTYDLSSVVLILMLG